MKLLEVELLTDNLVETKEFYASQLEFPIINQTSRKISFLAGSSVLTFTKSNNINPNYHFAFNIPYNKLSEAINWLSEKVTLIKNSNYEIITKFGNWNAESIYFYDNNNNILELIARFDLKNSSDYAFSIFSIESISEIGIVTESPMSLGEELITNYGLSYFSKGPQRDDFVALGDDNGLILISRTNRNWYPTNDSAKKHSTKIKFIKDNITNELFN